MLGLIAGLLTALVMAVSSGQLQTATALDLDTIPESPAAWTEQGVVLTKGAAGQWDDGDNFDVWDVVKIDNTWYLYYGAGFAGGLWPEGPGHKSVGVATSTDGINFSKSPSNPILIPHDFVPVESHEEGIRGAAFTRDTSGKVVGHVGVESPGGPQTCPYLGTSGCAGDIQVDSRIYAVESNDGINFTIVGAVSGVRNGNGRENYPSDLVISASTGTAYSWNHIAEDTIGSLDQTRAASTGSIQNMTLQGLTSSLQWGWASLEAFIHNDNDTVTLVYTPRSGPPLEVSDDTYHATTSLSNPRTITNERIVRNNERHFRSSIVKDTAAGEWKWYYTKDAAPGEVHLRTAPLQPGGGLTNVAQGRPVTVSSVDSSGDFPGSKAVDGNRDSTNNLTRWVSSGSASLPQTLEVDFGSSRNISKADVYTGWYDGSSTTFQISAMKLQSWNGSNWVDVPGASVSSNSSTHVTWNFTSVSTSKVRLVATQSAQGIARVFELEIWGN